MHKAIPRFLVNKNNLNLSSPPPHAIHVAFKTNFDCMPFAKASEVGQQKKYGASTTVHSNLLVEFSETWRKWDEGERNPGGGEGALPYKKDGEKIMTGDV